MSYVQGDYADADDVRAGRRGDRRGEAAGLLPRDPAVPLRHRRPRPRQGRPDRERPGGDREALRPRPRVGPGAERRTARGARRGPDPADRPLPRQGAGDGHHLPALRQLAAGAGLEPRARRLRADDDGRGLRSRGPRPLLRPGRGAARRRPEPHPAGAGAGRDGAARPATSRDSIRDKKLELFKAVRSADPKRYVRGQYEGYRDVEGVADGLDHRDLRRARARDRQLALERRAVLHPRRQEDAGQGDRGQRRVQAPAATRRRRSASARARTR